MSLSRFNLVMVTHRAILVNVLTSVAYVNYSVLTGKPSVLSDVL